MENLIMENLIKELDKIQDELRGKDIKDLRKEENMQKYYRMKELMKEIYGI